MHIERLRADTELVRRNIKALKDACPELADDTELLANTIEGETDFDTVLEHVMDAFIDAVTMKEAVTNRASVMSDRARMWDRKAEAMRTLAFELLQAAGKDKVTLPTATLSVRSGLERVVVENEAILPQGFIRVERTPNRVELMKALKSGDQIPGAFLETGPASLQIRTR